MFFHRISAIAALLLWLHPAGLAQPGGTAPINSQELHGGIEIGPKAVHFLALRISNNEEGYNVKIIHSDSIVPATSFPQDGRLSQAYIRDVAHAVQKSCENLRRNFQVPDEHIYLIGLSDIAPQNPDELIREVRNRTGKTINFLTSETEVQLGIAGIIPLRYKSANKWFDNRGISALIEIGHTTIKGGYQQLRRTTSGAPDYDYVTWIIPRGAASFADEAGKAAGEAADYEAFAKKAQALSVSAFRNPIKTEAAQKPGLITRKKIYLCGGLVSALVTLLHPEDQRSYIPITLDDIEVFYRRAVTDPESLLNPDLSKIRDETLRNEVRRSRESIKQSFPPRTLIAGAEILRSLAAELAPPDKTMIYARHSHLARILSYVRLQPE